MPSVTKLKIKLQTLHCHLASADVSSEPGTEDEWRMTFTVDGQPHTWREEHVRTGQDYHLGFVYTVDVDPNHPHKTIQLSATGVEEDSTSANDIMPSAEDTIDPKDEWQIGNVYSFSGSNSEYAYEIFYEVKAAEDGQPLTIAREYVGACRAGSGADGLWASPWPGFEQKWKQWSSQGLRLTRLASYHQDAAEWTIGPSGNRIFIGTFRAGSDNHSLWLSEWPSFEAKWKELSQKGLRLADLCAYKVGTKQRFAGVYHAGTDGYALWVAPWPSFEAKWKELSAGGLRLVALDTYQGASARYYTGVFRAGNDGHALWVGAGWDAFKVKHDAFAKQGLRLIDIASYPSGKNHVFGGVWRAGGDANAILPPQTWTEFTNAAQMQSQGGKRLVTLETFIPHFEE
jgi:Bacterial tandem repeat domain 1